MGVVALGRFDLAATVRRWLVAALAIVALVSWQASAASLSWAGAGGHRAAPPPVPTGSRSVSAADVPFDVDSVVERTTHAVVAAPDRPGTFGVPGADYDARLDGRGLSVGGLRIAVDGIARAGAPAIPVATGPWTPDGNTASRPVAAGVTEQVTAGTDGVEWDVVLDHRPSGTGSLVVSADLDGLDPSVAPVRVDDGWQVTVRDRSTVTLDELVVVDATGTEVHRALPAIDGDQLRLTVPASVLDTAAYPLTLDPTVAPERLVSAKRAFDESDHPDVAFDGTNYLVVWYDYRNGISPDIYGARVTQDGAVLDPTGIAIDTFFGGVEPAVAFDGTNFFVVWQEDGDIHGRFVGKDGVPGTSLDIATDASSSEEPDVAFAGGLYIVTWSNHSSGASDIAASRILPDGTRVDGPAGVVVSIAPGAQEHVAIASSGDTALIVWDDTRSGNQDVWGTRFGPGGLLDPLGLPIAVRAGSQHFPAVDFDGARFFVVWGDDRSGDPDIYGGRVTTAGTLQDPSGLFLSGVAGSSQDRPAVAHRAGGTHYVVWEDRRTGATNVDTYGARVNDSGTTLDTGGGVAINTADFFQLRPAVAASPAGFLVLRHDASVDLGEAVANRISTGGANLDPNGILVSSDVAAGGSDPAVAFDGTNYLVVWSAGGDILGARMSAKGLLLDYDPITIAAAADAQTQPAVAFDGTRFLVVWQDARTDGLGDIYGARVSKAGVVVDTGGGFPIAVNPFIQAGPDIAFNGARYLVVWQDLRNGLSDAAYAARVATNGTVLDPNGIPVSSDFFAAKRFIRVGSNGTDFLVAWHDERNQVVGDLFAARVLNNGTVADPAGIEVAKATNQQSMPSIASDGTNYLVAWSDGRTDAAGDIWGARVTAAGAVLDPNGFVIAAATGSQRLPDVAFNGSYLVVWTDRRDGSGLDRIYGARVKTNGQVQDVNGFPIETLPPDVGDNIEVTAGQGDQWAVTYTRGPASGVYLSTVAPK